MRTSPTSYYNKFKMHPGHVAPKTKQVPDNNSRIDEDKIRSLISSRNAKYLENTVDADAEFLYDPNTMKVRKSPMAGGATPQLILKSGIGANLGTAPRVSLYRAKI
jgi:hypothetical protein